VVIQAALAKVEGVVKGAVKIIARLTYRNGMRRARAGSADLSALRGEDGGVAHLAPNLWGDLRRGGGDQTWHICLHRATSWSLRKGSMFSESARRAFCSA